MDKTLIITFICDLIISFIGVLMALIVQNNAQKSDNKKNALKYLNRIKLELSSIIVKLEKFNPNDEYEINPLKTPVWDGLLNSNDVALLLEFENHTLKKNKNLLWYNKLFELYQAIYDFNKWNDLYIKIIFSASKEYNGEDVNDDIYVANNIYNDENIENDYGDLICNFLIEEKDKFLGKNEDGNGITIFEIIDILEVIMKLK